MNHLKASLLATAICAAGIASAHAADSTPVDFKVQIEIDPSCEVVSTDAIVFDDAFAQVGSVSKTGNVVVQCTNGQPYDVTLNAGDNASDDIGQRKMLHEDGSATIAYQLYQDVGGAVWGDDVGVNTVAGTGAGIGKASYHKVHTVNAVATLAGDELPGGYEDTVTATVVF